EGTWDRLSWARLSSLRHTRRAPLGAQASLSHHARLSADERASRARYDAAHLDGSGQSRLCERGGRHAETQARAPRSTAPFGDVCELTLRGGKAGRLFERAGGCVASYGSGSLWYPRVRLYGCARVPRIHRVRPRCSDVHRQTRLGDSTRDAFDVSAVSPGWARRGEGDA